MFCIGDRVVYPMHGAGIIESIEERRILRERHQYYVMKMPIGEMTVMIPVDNSDEIGIRNVISKEEAERVMESFCNIEIDLDTNWNKRYRENMEKIKDGNIIDVAVVVKSLMMRDKIKGLSTGERNMLSTAKHIFISELALSRLDEYRHIEERLDGYISRAVGV